MTQNLYVHGYSEREKERLPFSMLKTIPSFQISDKHQYFP